MTCPPQSETSPVAAATTNHTRTLTPIRAGVTTIPDRRATDHWRVCRIPARTQSGHWNPTAAETMHSVQIGRSQRWQRTAAARRACW